MAWFDVNSGSKTHPVGGKLPNELRLYDMSGNVWEWCQDTYEPYPCTSKLIFESGLRVGRGGGWGHALLYCRSANRDRVKPTHRSYDIGFRLAASSF